jgi:iron complex transport system substrate-binding protein
VSLKPDVVIIRVGDCTIDFRDSAYANMKGVFESLGIPVVTLLASHLNEQGTLMCIDEEIRILGQVFNTADEAERLITYLHHSTADFTQRIHNQKPEKPPEVLLLGLSPSSRNRGGAANVMGLNTIESHILEDILLAKNAFRERGYFRILNVENILKLNPDAIVLHTSSGYHPAQELLASPNFKIFRGLKAVRNKRVAALPWSPCNCDKRLEYPIDIMVMAVTAYPEMFEDVNLERWLLDFYMGLYQVNEPTARALIKCQWMEWISQ